MKTGKHVMFLGAGTSCGSGYPLANGLRLLISSRENWGKALLNYGNKHTSAGPPGPRRKRAISIKVKDLAERK